MPGAVRAVPSDGSQVNPPAGGVDAPKARFSLAGVQMKLSVMKNTGKGGGLTLPLRDGEGQYIAKFPSTAFQGVAENEYANLALAEAIGMEVPERELVEKSDFAGIPEEFSTLSDGKVLRIRRFDRSTHDERIHIEDVAQVFGVYPARKYVGAAYQDIARAVAIARSTSPALEFVRRVAKAVMTGNGDMHLKNWSLIYPRDGAVPALAPVYDLLSTVPYIPADNLALSVGGERSFKAITAARWRTFANRARLAKVAVLQAVAETAWRGNASWWTLSERVNIPDEVLKRMDAHVDAMTPLMAVACFSINGLFGGRIFAVAAHPAHR
nr:HipA domain-containing protein [Asticcacaulis currens]